MRKAVFLDKDGTLVEDVPYNVDPHRIVLAAGARSGCAALSRAGYALVVVTNQSGIARGLFAPEALEAVEVRLRELLSVPLTGFYHCPHEAEDGCVCRKPGDAMLRRAAHDLDLDLAASWMIGDILNDVEAGKRAGCRAILIDNGGETEWKAGRLRTPDAVCRDMDEAAQVVLQDLRIAA